MGRSSLVTRALAAGFATLACPWVFAQAAPTVAFHFENKTEDYARVLVVSARTGTIFVNYECVPRGQIRDWKIPLDTKYLVTASGAGDSACTQVFNDGGALFPVPRDGAVRMVFVRRYEVVQQ